MKYLIILFTLLTIASCQQTEKKQQEINIDLQGHRGARGLLPENTIPAFLKALEYSKVTTLELDLAVTKDHHLVVSHEPWFNPAICSDSLGSTLSEEEKISIYQLTYDQIRTFDCGSNGNPRFPEQQKMQVSKPLLSEVINVVSRTLSEQQRPQIQYNIEIKSHPSLDSIFTPSPEDFSNLVYNFIKENMNIEKVTVQSFDFRVLKYFHKKYPDVKLVALIENKAGIAANLSELGFNPDIYSPYYKMLSRESVDSLHQQNIIVTPWTVNDTTDMKQLIEWQIDGIITDYPNLAQKILE